MTGRALPAATHRIFVDRFVGRQDRGRGAEGGCCQQAVERLGVMREQFGCAIDIRTPQAQTVEAPGGDLSFEPVSRRVRQEDLAGDEFQAKLSNRDTEQWRLWPAWSSSTRDWPRLDLDPFRRYLGLSFGGYTTIGRK